MSNRVDQILLTAQKRCETRGVRLTAKRKLVLKGLASSSKALSAYDLVEYIQRAFGESIPSMTIYRILEFFQVESIVHKLYLANKYVVCAHVGCSGSHEASYFIVCCRCSDVSELPMQADDLSHLKNIVKQSGYQEMGSNFEISATCMACKNQVA